MNALTVVHCVGEYLPTTENWTFQLIKHQVDIEKYVASGRFVDCPFYLEDTHYLRRAVTFIDNLEFRHHFLNRMFRVVYRILRKGYLTYVAEQLEKIKVNIVHSHFATTGWQYQSLAARLGAIHVVSFYGMDYEYIAHTQPEWKERYVTLFKSATAFVCEGAYGATTLKKLGCPESKVHIAKLGVDVAEIPFFPREKNENELRLLQVASFREKKGHVDSITAFAQASRKFPNMSLTFIGNGDIALRKKIEGMTIQLGISAKVHFLPGISFASLHETMANYHVFIQPSRHTQEKDCEGGAPIVLLDAQATGMPVISTFHCDIPDEVLNYRTGILCTETDIQQLDDAIGVFYRMTQTNYSEYSKNAREHIARAYDIKKNADLIVDLYRKLQPEKQSV